MNTQKVWTRVTQLLMFAQNSFQFTKETNGKYCSSLVQAVKRHVFLFSIHRTHIQAGQHTETHSNEICHASIMFHSINKMRQSEIEWARREKSFFTLSVKSNLLQLTMAAFQLVVSEVSSNGIGAEVSLSLKVNSLNYGQPLCMWPEETAFVYWHYWSTDTATQSATHTNTHRLTWSPLPFWPYKWPAQISPSMRRVTMVTTPHL